MITVQRRQYTIDCLHSLFILFLLHITLASLETFRFRCFRGVLGYGWFVFFRYECGIIPFRITIFHIIAGCRQMFVRQCGLNINMLCSSGDRMDISLDICASRCCCCCSGMVDDTKFLKYLVVYGITCRNP